MRLILAGAAAFSALAASAPASAQYSTVNAAIGATVGNMVAAAKERECMIGTPMPPSEIEEARSGAEAAMRSYLRVAGGGSPADVGALFGRKAKAGSWSADGAAQPLKGVDDGFARRVAAGEARIEPVALVRAGDGGSAAGVWLLRAAGGGDPLGRYEAAFRRQAGVWMLSRLSLVSGAQAPAAPAQYCHRPGDVEVYRQSVLAAEEERARRKAARAARRAKRAG